MIAHCRWESNDSRLIWRLDSSIYKLSAVQLHKNWAWIESMVFEFVSFATAHACQMEISNSNSTHFMRMLAIITFPRTKLALEFSLIPYHLCLGKGNDWCLHFFCFVLFWRGKLEKFSLLSGSGSMDSCGTTRPNLERNGVCREILTSSRKWIH